MNETVELRLKQEALAGNLESARELAFFERHLSITTNLDACQAAAEAYEVARASYLEHPYDDDADDDARRSHIMSSVTTKPSTGKYMKVVYQCPRCATSMEVDPSAKPSSSLIATDALEQMKVGPRINQEKLGALIEERDQLRAREKELVEALERLAAHYETRPEVRARNGALIGTSDGTLAVSLRKARAALSKVRGA